MEFTGIDFVELIRAVANRPVSLVVLLALLVVYAATFRYRIALRLAKNGVAPHWVLRVALLMPARMTRERMDYFEHRYKHVFRLAVLATVIVLASFAFGLAMQWLQHSAEKERMKAESEGTQANARQREQDFSELTSLYEALKSETHDKDVALHSIAIDVATASGELSVMAGQRPELLSVYDKLADAIGTFKQKHDVDTLPPHKRLFLKVGEASTTNSASEILTLLPSDYLRSIENVPSSWVAHAYQLRGWALHDQNKWESALGDYKEAFRHDVDSMPIRAGLADCLRHVKEYEVALKQTNMLVDHYREHTELQDRRACQHAYAYQLQARAMLHSALENRDAALTDVNLAIQLWRGLLEGDTGEVSTRLYDCLGHRGDLLSKQVVTGHLKTSQ